MRQLLRRLQADAVVVTQGERGLSLLESDGAFIHLPALAREVADGTGAGDTTVAATALALAAGAPFRTAVALGNYAAGIVVGKLGTGVVTPKELSDAIGATD
jgi:D-beta-D-heptose 7-phosphate kinase/D-beta-D-heptose 1-phosphate adenosyltransferase